MPQSRLRRAHRREQELTTNKNHKGKAWVTPEREPDRLRLVLGGEWVTAEIASVDEPLRRVGLEGANLVQFDCGGLERLDSAGAWLLLRTKRALEEAGAKDILFSIPERYLPLLEAIERGHDAPPVQPLPRRTLLGYVGEVGEYTLQLLSHAYYLLGFVGRVTVEALEAFVRPTREIPWPAFVKQVEETGLNALPIVGLLSFLIGIVIAYQGADQLRQFGAELLTINLLGVSMLREIGGLMTAIIVAGRSGSAFTAQIGTMKVNQEIDAMQTIGINIVEVLVLPRVFALTISLFFLTFYANVMGIIGGAVMVYWDLGYTMPIFIRQLESAITINTLLVGLIKAPVFAILIALVGCLEGLRVENNAESVGQQTTRSVVEGIFLVIVFDAGFSIVFSLLGI